MTGRKPAEPESYLPLRPQELAILMVLGRGALHAWGIAEASEEASTVRLEIGSLYRMLNRMLSDGWIAEDDSDEATRGGAGIRRTYRITDHGRSVAAAETRRLAAVVEAAREQQLLGGEGES